METVSYRYINRILRKTKLDCINRISDFRHELMFFFSLRFVSALGHKYDELSQPLELQIEVRLNILLWLKQLQFIH